MRLHDARREALIKVDDGGYSLGQVMKFAVARELKDSRCHYLENITNVDGAAVFLGLEPRRDLTEDFHSALMKRNPDLQYSPPGMCLDELRQRWNLLILITAAITKKGCQELKAQQRYFYDRRQKLINEESTNYHRTQQRVQSTQCEVDDQGEWHRTYFDRGIRRMVPRCDRLAPTLPIAAPLQNPEGIFALQDLIALSTNDYRVAYEELLRPIGNCCSIPTSGQEIKE
ncbi:hypothetical protein BTUL_0378g00020 [Botrytis tulipae]|uniref:Uncharacterized protein n=1 Tax=Botrytis tulipae TaxID=87230 RepID=A0A4Z1EC73_9HELO|nr:hypothetical protein BTUL_0378g00020 [Botrytis tulipae]